jgi:hypothetical protein
MGIDMLKEDLGGCWRKCSLTYTLHGRVVAVDASVLCTRSQQSTRRP